MKTTVSFIAAILMFAAPAFAQFTLVQGSFPANPTGVDSVSSSYGTTGVPATIGASGTNLIWDFSGLSYTVTDTSFALHLPYTGYSYQELAVHYVKRPTLYYDARSLFNIGAGGIIKEGEKIDGKSFSLAGAMGASLTDSIVFPPQIDTYSAPYTKLAFPGTINNTWGSALQVAANFTITYGAMYNHTPCTYRSYLSEKDSVIGYGKAIIKTADNKISDSIAVIEVKVRYNQVDSFFNGSVPFDPTSLSYFTLSQGQKTTSFDIKYYRANETTPLADVFFADSSFNNQSIVHTYIHTQRLPLPSAVAEIAVQNNISVYPNPTANGVFTIHIPGAMPGTIRYNVVNVAGQVIITNNIAAPGNVQLPAGTAPGIYYLQLYNNDKQVCIKPIEVR